MNALLLQLKLLISGDPEGLITLWNRDLEIVFFESLTEKGRLDKQYFTF